jgi:hypothetical protein
MTMDLNRLQCISHIGLEKTLTKKFYFFKEEYLIYLWKKWNLLIEFVKPF